MKVWSNIDGTTSQSFGIGIDGVTIHQGDDTPSNSVGVSGDIFLRKGESPAIFQKDGSNWRVATEKFVHQAVAQGTTTAISDTATYVGVTAASGTTTLTLPTPYSGKKLVIKNETGGTATINITGAPINGTTLTLTDVHACVTLMWIDEWSIIRRL